MFAVGKSDLIRTSFVGLFLIVVAIRFIANCTSGNCLFVAQVKSVEQGLFDIHAMAFLHTVRVWVS